MTLTKQGLADMRLLATDVDGHQALYKALIMRVKDKLISAQLTQKITSVDFYRITALMNSQMRVPRWGKYCIENYGFNAKNELM